MYLCTSTGEELIVNTIVCSYVESDLFNIICLYCPKYK